MGATEKGAKSAIDQQATAGGPPRGLQGLTIRRVYSDASVSPYDAIEWELRTASITSEKGETIFEQKNVEVPRSWSQTATNIVVQKYFHGRLGTPERETSVKQLIERVAQTITGYGEKGGYFKTGADRDAFHDELAAILVNQVASFNSPVWFNVGIEPKPQGSACFINSCADSMSGILDLAKTEGMLFKFGSGTGSNLSCLRGSTETLSSGGTASGPLSFMKGFDSFAGAIKSGGKTRRAAKMVILNIDHPDIDDFILSKANEEKKAWALIDAGYDGSFNGEAYASIFYQNANHSVRVTDEFMHAVESDGDWWTKEVLSGRPFKKYKARELMADIADAAWICGDPGMQYDTTINRWNPVKSTHRINASNPCSEYMFVDDSACNLASLNLMKFFNAEDGGFDVESFRHACDIVISAQEMLVDNCSYPTEKIAQNSHKFRPLGLGYANLGALLMATGVPYDSDEGRAYSAAITSLMCGEAYLQSSKIASELGPFAGYEPNRDAFLDVIGMHRDAAYKVPAKGVPAELAEGAEGRLGRGPRVRQGARLQERPGHGPRAHRHDRLHDGLRHDRRRARPRARQVQEARRRRHDQDRQQHRPAGFEAPRLHGRPDQRHRGLRGREGDHRGCARLQARAPARLRLRVPRPERQPLDPLHRPRPDDGGRPAVPLRRHLQDRQPAARCDS